MTQTGEVLEAPILESLSRMFGKGEEVVEGSESSGILSFDSQTGELARGGESRRLEPRASCVLAALWGAPDQIVTRQELLDRCWGESEGSDEALTQAISQIRRALVELDSPSGLVETLPKRGYRLRSDRRSPAGMSGQMSVILPPWNKPTRILIALLVVAIFAFWIAFPHAPRHFVRHALGLNQVPSDEGLHSH